MIGIVFESVPSVFLSTVVSSEPCAVCFVPCQAFGNTFILGISFMLIYAPTNNLQLIFIINMHQYCIQIHFKGQDI